RHASVVPPALSKHRTDGRRASIKPRRDDISVSPQQPVHQKRTRTSRTMAPKKAKKKEAASSNVFSMFEQSQIQEFKEAFTIMDQNRDGFIDKNDLRDTFAALGRLNVGNDELDEMLKEAPGPINFTIFLSMFGEKLKGNTTTALPHHSTQHHCSTAPQHPTPLLYRTTAPNTTALPHHSTQHHCSTAPQHPTPLLYRTAAPNTTALPHHSTQRYSSTAPQHPTPLLYRTTVPNTTALPHHSTQCHCFTAPQHPTPLLYRTTAPNPTALPHHSTQRYSSTAPQHPTPLLYRTTAPNTTALPHHRTDPEETILNAFKIFDPEGTGILKGEEIKYHLMSQADKFTEAEVNQMFTNFPLDVAGNLDYKNLCYVITHGEDKEQE
ncbi:hypothetical protein NFI96_018417, partial [Prochilodus magdalenae]